jgi:beta-glucuronidase
MSAVDRDSLVPVEPFVIPLSGEWRFAIDPDGGGEAEGWAESGFDDSSWSVVEIPHTWGVMEEHSRYDGLAWYRRTFQLSGEAAEAHLQLRFEAVFYLARVWLNGEYLGEHEGGYTPFEFDVSGIAMPGEENAIAVQVDNERSPDRIPAVLSPEWSFDWWNYGGIVRDVALQVSSRAYIADQRIVARPNIVAWDEADTAQVSITVVVENAAPSPLQGTLSGEILEDATGLPVPDVSVISPLSVAPGESVELELRAEIERPNLWHFDHPHLYRWSATLRDTDGQLLHVDETTFGIRSVELREAELYLNGEPVRLVGLTRHADSPEHGLAETVTVMAADYDDMKRLNMVFSRPVHYPQSEFILDYCDRNGILLIPEVPSWQLNDRQLADADMRGLARQQLIEMIAADYNHPSVWAWSVGNEFDSRSPAGHDYVQDLVSLAHELDPTRPVGFASNRLDSRPSIEASSLADFILMNQYFGTWVGPKGGLGDALDEIHATWPEKVVIISEFGFEPHWNRRWGPPTSQLDPSQYYYIAEDAAPDSDEADEQRRQVIVEQMEVFRSKPFIAGAIFWTYQDYRTPSDFVMGVVDPERNRRGSWELLREEYSPVVVDGVSFLPAAEGASVSLHARGPVEQELPAYTLREYTLAWSVLSVDGEEVFSQGEILLPTLAPGQAWSGDLEWPAPPADYVLRLTVIRPTGFSVIERIYNPWSANPE